MPMLLIVGTKEPLYAIMHAYEPTGVFIEPLFRYEAEFGNSQAKSDDTAHLNQFILHSAMDMVELLAESTSNMYLRIVDRFNDQNVTAGNICFLLLHEGRNEEHVKNFFQEVYEAYVKVLMNPFYTFDTPILSTSFDQRIHTIARRYM